MFFVPLFYRSSTFPPKFLKNARGVKKNKVCVKEYTYDRDIICIPKCMQSTSSSCITIPRSKKAREMLARNGLIGKIRITSLMSETNIMSEIRSVFSLAMKEKPDFSFKILQSSGGNSKSLSVPSLSSSFRWTAGALAGKNSKMPIYILAEDEIEVVFIKINFHVKLL